MASHLSLFLEACKAVNLLRLQLYRQEAPYTVPNWVQVPAYAQALHLHLTLPGLFLEPCSLRCEIIYQAMALPRLPIPVPSHAARACWLRIAAWPLLIGFAGSPIAGAAVAAAAVAARSALLKECIRRRGLIVHLRSYDQALIQGRGPLQGPLRCHGRQGIQDDSASTPHENCPIVMHFEP